MAPGDGAAGVAGPPSPVAIADGNLPREGDRPKKVHMYKELDEQIIEQLKRDGRASLREIAQALGVSTTTVSKHLGQLEQRGVIRGFKPVLDYPKLGYSITAITQIKAKGNLLHEIVDSLKEDDRLTHVYEITGEFDLLVIGKFRDQESMNREIKRLLNHPAVEQTNTSIVLSAPKEEGDIRLASLEGTTPDS